MSYDYPDLSRRLDAVKDAVAWASGVNAVWIDQNDGGRVRQPNKAWIELRPRRILDAGTQDVRHVDLETPETEGTLEFPRQEVYVLHKEIQFEARARSRSQEHTESGWFALMKTQDRLFQSYAINRWMKPNYMARNKMGDVVNMPRLKVFDNRVEDVAVLEFSINTALCDTDSTNLGTWIDRALVSSNLINTDGNPLDESLQLDDEVMGWADATHVVDENGNFVVDGNGRNVVSQ